MRGSLLAALFIGASLLAAPALAHSGKIETSIHDKDSFAAAPATFKVTFEHDSTVASVMLMTADNKMVAVDFKPSTSMGKEVAIPLPHLAKGVYTLSWKSVAKDGHAEPGIVHFTVTG